MASPEILSISTASNSPKLGLSEERKQSDNNIINNHESPSLSSHSSDNSLSIVSNKNLKGLLMIRELETNKKIGLNPFAGVYLSTIKCLKCGPTYETHGWEVFYDLS